MKSTDWHKHAGASAIDSIACVSRDTLGHSPAAVTLTLRNLKAGSYLHSYMSCEEAQQLAKQLLNAAAEVERVSTTKLVRVLREGELSGRIGYAKWYPLVEKWDVCFAPTHRDWFANHEVEEVEEEV